MRLISSLSNASLQKYPLNTLTKFTHYLPSPIHIPSNKSFCIALRSISIHTILKEDYDVGYVKIHLNELNPRTSAALGDDQCLARIPFIKHSNSQHSSTFWYDILHPIPIQLANCSALHELNFLITDQDNKQLQLTSGPTTVLTMELSEMEYSDQFSMTCNPYDYTRYRDTNSNIDFHTFLPRAMELSEDWDVALHSIVVPQDVYLDQVFYARFEHLGFVEVIGHVRKKEWKISEYDVTNIKEQMTKFFAEWGLHFTFHSDRIEIRAEERDGDDKLIGTFILNERLCRALGFVGHDGKGWSRVFFGVPGEIQTISKPKKLGVAIDHLALYTDIVKNSFIGNTEAPILDILSTEALGLHQQKSATLFYVPQLTFRPISRSEFSSVHFMLHTLDGSQIALNDKQKKGISITLLFRKRMK